MEKAQHTISASRLICWVNHILRYDESDHSQLILWHTSTLNWLFAEAYTATCSHFPDLADSADFHYESLDIQSTTDNTGNDNNNKKCSRIMQNSVETVRGSG